MALLEVGELPAEPLAAAAEFHAAILPRILAALAVGTESLTLVFPPAGHPHRDWRLAAIHGLAREHAPRRINAVASADPAAIAAAARYLEHAAGVTGQYLPLDSHGAGTVVIPQA